MRHTAVRDLATDIDEVQRARADGRKLLRCARENVDRQDVGAEDKRDVVVQCGDSREQRGGSRETKPTADAVTVLRRRVDDEVNVDCAGA